MATSKFGLPGVAGMLVGPAVKENNGSSHCSSHGLLAYGAGSSIVIVDVRSMQIVTVLPMPCPGTTASQAAPFVTALQWTPEGLQSDLVDESLTGNLHLAVGDRQGRIAIWNVRCGDVSMWLGLEADKGRLGIQDVCWVYGKPWLLLSIHGTSLISIWDTTTGRSIWRLDASPEILTCVKRDPFDARQICIVSSKGLLLSVYIGGLLELDISVKRHQLNILEERSSNAIAGAGKGNGAAVSERDVGKDGGSVSSISYSATSAAASQTLLAGNNGRCLFSTSSRGILYITFPRELFVFDLQFGTVLSNSSLPRGCSRFLDLIANADGDVVYCAHVDGKLTAWLRKQNQQAYSLSFMDALLPQLGTSVPAPVVLSVVNCSYQIFVEKSENIMESASFTAEQMKSPSKLESLPAVVLTAPVAGNSNPLFSRVKYKDKMPVETTIISISDDGRLLHWSIISGGSSETKSVIATEESSFDNKINEIIGNGESGRQEFLSGKLESSLINPIFKLMLTDQLSLLPSTITTLAVPVPSLLATVPGGGNGPAISAPLVALATQGGTIEVVDALSNAVTSSFLVHPGPVRGLRWLGNSRLVSFSFTEIKGKGGGYVNNLVVTCVRSGQSKAFRVLQKPERAPVRFLRTSPSGRYLLILFREAPAEVWAMTKNPQMLRSLALPFTVMEWALPPAPKVNTSSQHSSTWKPSPFYKDKSVITSTTASVNVPSLASPRLSDPGPGLNTDNSQDESAESFAFALVNGSLGVFELRGRRVRDFRPKWPSASFVSADVLVTAMAYRTPHVVMGDRSGNIRWWDVNSGMSSTFNSHRGGVRRIKFAPVVPGDQTRGRVAVLFNDHTFAIYDLNTQDPLKNAIVQSQIGGILVSELDWFPLRFADSDIMLLCIAGADGSFRLLEVNISVGSKSRHGSMTKASAYERFQPIPFCSPALLPLPHALALRMLLQLGVQPSWLNEKFARISENSDDGDLRSYMLETSLPELGEVVVAELLLKSLEPYRKAGRLLDLQRSQTYAALASKGSTLRFAFAAAHFGDYNEALFWLQLPHALGILNRGSSCSTTFRNNITATSLGNRQASVSSAMSLTQRVVLSNSTSPHRALDPDQVLPVQKDLEVIPNDQALVYAVAMERIKWHDKLQGPEAVQKRVHEYISLGDFEAAVTLLLSTPPESSNFYVDALRAISLASAVSPALHELAVKVVAANLVATDNSLSGTHLLCAVGCYPEACTQLQDTGRWLDAATLAAVHLQGADYSRVLQRWADHVLHNENNLWRAMILYVAAGALTDALAALRDAKQPDTAAMFLLACHESKMVAVSDATLNLEQEPPSITENIVVNELSLPGDLDKKKEEIRAACEYYGQYQIALAHLCTGVAPVLT